MMTHIELMKRWVGALRSGDYDQTHGSLRSLKDGGDYCHCAVGVLADVIDPDGWTGTRGELPGIYHDDDGELNGDMELNDYPKVYWKGSAFGISEHVAELGLDPFVVSGAMCMNDDHHNSFEQIADYLERKLP